MLYMDLQVDPLGAVLPPLALPSIGGASQGARGLGFRV